MYMYDVVDDDEFVFFVFVLDEEVEIESGELRVMRDVVRIFCASVVIGNLVSVFGEV